MHKDHIALSILKRCWKLRNSCRKLNNPLGDKCHNRIDPTNGSLANDSSLDKWVKVKMLILSLTWRAKCLFQLQRLTWSLDQRIRMKQMHHHSENHHSPLGNDKWWNFPSSFLGTTPSGDTLRLKSVCVGEREGGRGEMDSILQA